MPSTVRSATDTVIRGWRTGSRLCPLGTVIVTGTRCECVPGAAPCNLAARLGWVGLGRHRHHGQQGRTRRPEWNWTPGPATREDHVRAAPTQGWVGCRQVGPLSTVRCGRTQARLAVGVPQGNLTDREQGWGAGEARGSPGAPPHSCTASEGNIQPPDALPRKMLAAVTSGSTPESVLGTESRLRHPESSTLP